MVRLALALFAVGCNQVYGLDETTLRDARPQGCPEPGTQFTFSTAPQAIVIDRYTNYYQLDRAQTFAIAVRSSSVLKGAVDSDVFEPVIVDPNVNHEIGLARLAPEGNQIFVEIRDRITDVTSLDQYDLVGATWERTGTLPITLADEFDRISAPTSRDGARRMLLLTRASVGFAKVIQELVEDDAGTWTKVGASYSAFDLGVDGIFDPNLTPDGLRVVFSGFGFSGENALYYAERPSLDARFGAAAPLLTLIGNGLALSPFVTSDCDRMYFYAVPGIHYVRR